MDENDESNYLSLLHIRYAFALEMSSVINICDLIFIITLKCLGNGVPIISSLCFGLVFLIWIYYFVQFMKNK